jgi:hypothetical protein
MIPYSMSNGNRRKVIYALAATAIIIPNLVSSVLFNFVGFRLGENTYGLHGASMGLFIAMFWVFNNYLWRTPLISDALGMTNLSGVWLGTLERTEYPSGIVETATPITVTVKQTYSKMLFRLENEFAESQSGPTLSTSQMICLGGDKETGYTLREGFLFQGGFGATDWKLVRLPASDRMDGEYVSSYPRTGKLSVARVGRKQALVRGVIERMTDTEGSAYLGVGIQDMITRKYHKKLSGYVGGATMLALDRNRVVRDGRHAHLTVVSPDELDNLSEAQIDGLIGRETPIAFGGIGKVDVADSVAYFAVCTSHHVAYMRSQVGLGHRDLHVTLGFEPTDIHGVSKGPNRIVCD